MGRRRGKSSAGTALLVLVGAVAIALSALYQFVLTHLAEIKVFCTVAGALMIVAYFVSKIGSRKSADAPQTATPSRIAAATAKSPDSGQDYRVTSATPRRGEGARWVPDGTRVEIGGTSIPGGMFYLGTSLSFDGRDIDGYVVNPKLPAKAARPDILATSMPYWPSYAEVPAASRRAFLDWMATGRSDPAYGIGHIFIFFYGLEHRLFAERDAEAAVSIVSEVRRLLAIYGGNDSFREYASRFLDAASLMRGEFPPVPVLSPERPYRTEMPLDIRLHLARRLAQSDVLLSEDALLWVLALPETYLRTPAVRCFAEFTALFDIRFRKKFPEGFPVKTTGNLEITYNAASRAFEMTIDGAYLAYPDPLKIATSFEPMRKLVQECTEGLDGFSRLLGRRPDARSSAHAALLLPEDLLAEGGFEALQVFGARLSDMMSGRNQASAKMRQLLELADFETPEAGKVSPGMADQLGRILDRLDVAIEPDRRCGGAVPQLEDQVFIFKAPEGGHVDPEHGPYKAMKARVEVAVLAAAADGEATGDEMQGVIANIKSDASLSGIERARLIAFAVTTFNSPPKQARLLKRLAEHSEEERGAIAAAAIAVVGANTTIDPQEVKFLEKLHKALGLPQERLYSDLHRAAPVDGPVAVSVERRIAGIPIPKEPEKAAAQDSARVRIDMERLARTRRETAEVSRLLSDIFEEDVQAPPEPPASTAAASALDGLDGPHAELVELLELKGAMSRAEFDERARAMKLLPDGAIERINDWSFDRLDEALLEEGDEIAIASHLRERLMELRETV